MPRPVSAQADMPEGSSSLPRIVAPAAAILSAVAGLTVVGWTLLHAGSERTAGALQWWLPAGLGCIAAAVAWLLWRQRELAGALADARLEAQRLAELHGDWQWRTDGTHRLTLLCPPAGAGADDALATAAIGRSLWDHLALDPAAGSALRMRMESGTRLSGLRLWRTAADGGRRLLEIRGASLLDHRGQRRGYVGALRLLDEESARDGDRHLLQALLAALPSPVFVLAGGAEGPTRVERGNEAASQWIGLAPSLLAGLAFGDWQSRLPQDLRAPVAQALASPEAMSGSVVATWSVLARRVATPPGSAGAGDQEPGRWVLILAPVPPSDAAPGGAQAEHESFSYTVSHDLRAPIRVVEGFTKILKEDYGPQLDRIGIDHLDRVLGAAARMNSMIDALLALAQLSARPLSRQPVNLSQLASYVVDDLRRQSPEREVTVHVEAGLQTQGDPTLLRMVLENLLGNAWKYSARRRDAEIWFERGVHEGQPCYTVRDNGAGFDMRFADRLFGVFQRLHSANDFPGTGVGLASVKRIVGRHGGEIWAESAVDRGSSFHFTLPAGRDAA